MAISNASNQIVKVNLIPGIIPSVLHLSQYDTGAGRPITFSVYDGSQAFTIPSGVSIAFEGTKPDGKGFSFTCSKSGNNALLTNYTNQMTALSGKIMCQLVFTDTSGGRVGSLPVLMVVTPAGINGDTVISDSDIEAIVAAQNQYAVLNARLDEAIDQMNATTNEAIDQMNATTNEAIDQMNTTANGLQNQYAVTNAKLDTAISATTQDSEVQDIRVKADGTTAASAGNAVREQITELNSVFGFTIDDISRKAFGDANVDFNLIEFTANWPVNSSTKLVEVDIPTGSKYHIIIKDPNGCVNENATIYLCEIDSDGNPGKTVKIIKTNTEYSLIATKDVKGFGVYIPQTNIIKTGKALIIVYSDYQETGDSLQNQINSVIDISTTWSAGFWNRNTKEFNTDSNYKHSDYIAINDVAIPIRYKLKVISTVPTYILFDKNKNYIDKKNTASGSIIAVDEVISDFKSAAYVVFESYTGDNTEPKIQYCNFYDSSVVGFIKTTDRLNQNQLSFAELVAPTNLFDYTSEDMCKPGWWYYSTSVGSTVSATQSGNTTHYVAIKVPVLDSTKITLGIYPNDLSRLVYWVGAVDADMRLIAYSIVNQNAPVTYNLPTGAVYFLASYNLGSANFDTYLPRVMAVNADAITGYSAYFKPYYKLLDCKTDAEESESVTKLQSIIGSSANNVTFKLPDKYDLVVGDTFQLFYKGIINAVNPEMYYVLVDCTKGNAYSRYFEVTPDSAGNITATFTLFGINHNVLDTKVVTLAVHAKASSPSSVKNVLCVGDSLTTAGQWVEELHRRLTGSGGTPVGDNLSNINFIGTRISNNVHYEGYGGWTIRSYNTENVSLNVREITCTHDKTEATDQHSVYRGPDGVLWKLETIQSDTIKIIAVSGEGRNFPNSGTLTWVSGGTNHSDIVYTSQQMAAGNPFWDSTANKVDFSKYATSLGVSSIDYVYVLLGWNSASWSESDYKADVQTFIDNVHAPFPNAIIVFSGLEIPARDGLGNNYGATGIYSRYYDLMQFVFNLDKWYADVAEANSNTYSYNLSGQFDTEYNMLTATRPANTRNSTEVIYQSNGVHPALPGQMQIADAAYRDITARL